MYFLYEWDYLNLNINGLEVLHICWVGQTWIHINFWADRLYQNCAFIYVVDQTLCWKSSLFFLCCLLHFLWEKLLAKMKRSVCSTKISEGKILIVLPFQTCKWLSIIIIQISYVLLMTVAVFLSSFSSTRI